MPQARALTANQAILRLVATGLFLRYYAVTRAPQVAGRLLRT